MGTVIAFPADAAARRAGLGKEQARPEHSATVVILPAIRIERYADETSGGSGCAGTPVTDGAMRGSR